jgi:hypothetical protein
MVDPGVAGHYDTYVDDTLLMNAGTISFDWSTPGAYGTLDVASSFQMTGGSFSVGPEFAVSVTGSLLQSGETLTFSGAGQLTATDTIVLSGGTTTWSTGGLLSAANGTDVQSGGVLTAYQGDITGNLTNEGTVNLGDNSTTGSLAVSSNYTQTGTPNAGLYGTSQSSQLQVSGLATLGGTLNVSYLNGFSPGPSTPYALVTFGSLSGAFGTVNVPPPGIGHWDARSNDPTGTFTLWVVFP